MPPPAPHSTKRKAPPSAASSSSASPSSAAAKKGKEAAPRKWSDLERGNERRKKHAVSKFTRARRVFEFERRAAAAGDAEATPSARWSEAFAELLGEEEEKEVRAAVARRCSSPGDVRLQPRGQVDARALERAVAAAGLSVLPDGVARFAVSGLASLPETADATVRLLVKSGLCTRRSPALDAFLPALLEKTTTMSNPRALYLRATSDVWESEVVALAEALPAGTLVANFDPRDSLLGDALAASSHPRIVAVRTRPEDFGVGGFDRVVCRVPSTHDGAFKRAKEWKEWRSSVPTALAPLHLAMCMRAIDCVKPGGRVVFVTDSLHPSENERVVAAVVDASNGAVRVLPVAVAGASKLVTKATSKIQGAVRMHPQHHASGEGFFFALLERVGGNLGEQGGGGVAWTSTPSGAELTTAREALMTMHGPLKAATKAKFTPGPVVLESEPGALESFEEAFGEWDLPEDAQLVAGQGAVMMVSKRAARMSDVVAESCGGLVLLGQRIATRAVVEENAPPVWLLEPFAAPHVVGARRVDVPLTREETFVKAVFAADTGGDVSGVVGHVALEPGCVVFRLGVAGVGDTEAAGDYEGDADDGDEPDGVEHRKRMSTAERRRAKKRSKSTSAVAAKATTTALGATRKAPGGGATGNTFAVGVLLSSGRVVVTPDSRSRLKVMFPALWSAAEAAAAADAAAKAQEAAKVSSSSSPSR